MGLGSWADVVGKVGKSQNDPEVLSLASIITKDRKIRKTSWFGRENYWVWSDRGILKQKCPPKKMVEITYWKQRKGPGLEWWNRMSAVSADKWHRATHCLSQFSHIWLLNYNCGVIWLLLKWRGKDKCWYSQRLTTSAEGCLWVILKSHRILRKFWINFVLRTSGWRDVSIDLASHSIISLAEEFVKYFLSSLNPHRVEY